MSAALNGDQRTALNALVQKGRSLLEADLFTTLEGEYGIHRSDGRIEDIAALSLDTRRSAVRADLLDVISFLRSEGETAQAAVDRLVREAAFTHLNRFIALRVAEGLGIMPQAIADGISSQGFRDFIEIAPASADEDWERFRLFLRVCADELSTDVPALFDPRNPLLELEPTTATFADLINLIAASDVHIWTAPDALGWSYQFFNSGDERREMRESSAPRNSRELAVRNQFFTPSYVVEFLVQNGLGAHLASGFPGLEDDLPLLVDLPEVMRAVDLEKVSVLDPACGSGHFLLGAYDVLESAWRLAGFSAQESAPRIVRSLSGIDIDPRAAQIAQAAVVFRARRESSEPLPRPNIVCARSLPEGSRTEELIADLPEHVSRVVRSIAEELRLAPVLGSLLKVEARLDSESKDIFGTGKIVGTLSEAAEGGASLDVRTQVLEALASIADSTTSTASQRLFAAEAQDAVRFVVALSQRYTAVLMNPPFGEPVPETKKYLKVAYPWLPKFEDLLAAFVGRGMELCEPEVGTCGAITSRAGLFLTTYEKWRTEVLLSNQMVALADLGNGVMEQALVESAAYVLRKTAPSGKGTFIRLLKDRDLGAALADAVSSVRLGAPDNRIFSVDLEDLQSIPGSPFAYWMDPSVRALFRAHPRTEPAGAEVRQGLTTSDDFQFVRTAWEVDPKTIGHSHEALETGRRWAPFAKGGAYSPWWADIHLLVEWENRGARLKSLVNSKYPYLNGNVGFVVKNEDHYFLGGVTWPRRTNSGFGVRLLPRGTVFADKGPAAIPSDSVSPAAVLGWLSSRLIQLLLDSMVAAGEQATSGGASRSYEVGLVQKLPWIHIPELEPIVGRMIERAAVRDTRDETTRNFVGPFGRSDRWASAIEQLEDGYRLDQLVLDAAELSDEGRRFVDREVGPYPTTYDRRSDVDERIKDLWSRPMADVIAELLEERGGSRSIANLTYVADRRLEVIAHGLEVHPESILRVVAERGLKNPGQVEDDALDMLSYLVGVGFGRWDLQVGLNQCSVAAEHDLASAPRTTAPGMRSLVEAHSEDPRSLRAISIPPDGLLIDDEGHEWDIAARTNAAAEQASIGEGALNEALGAIMRRPSLSGYIRSRFFKDHLSMYSMSRRKAPIYWQLQVPSKKWGVWLYMPRLSREMLFAVVRATEERQRLSDQRITTLQREYDDGGAGRSAAAVLKELNAEQDLSVELISFRDEADRIANLGWEPNLDDGAVLNAAPLAGLFPAWKDAAKYRNELRKGKHEWATVAQFADQL